MAKEYRFGQPEICERLEMSVSLHTLDRAFDRILRVLDMLKSRMALRAESVQAKSASIEAIRAAVNLELREAFGESDLKDFDEFSRNVKQMENQLIAECMDEAYTRNVTEADA